MPTPLADLELPSSYASLPFKQIRLSHYPESSPSPTPITILTLYRPGKHNAFTGTMMEEIQDAIALLDVDDRVKCIIVTGHGRIFCAGADLEISWQEPGEEATRDHRDGGGRVALAFHQCRKPIIGALQGSAVGVGITMTLPFAIRIAYKDAKIGFVFARRGLVMEACSSYFLPRLIGFSRAMHLVTTGATYRAEDKILGDLFSEVVDTPEGVLQRAIEIAKEVAENNSVVSTYLMKEMMYRNPGSPEGTHLMDSRVIFEMEATPDNKEGVQSFLQKRPANFKGSFERDAPAVYPWWQAPDITVKPKAKKDGAKAKL